MDLELRLAVGTRFGRQQQVVVGLLRVGALRAGPDDDPAGEDTPGGGVEHAVEIFVTFAVRLRVIDERVVVHVLSTTQQIETIEDGDRSWAIQHRAEIMPGEAATK